jgi:hypothetical protein
MEEDEPRNLPTKNGIRRFSAAEADDLCRSIPIQIVRDSRPTMNVVVRQSKLSFGAALHRTVPVSPNRGCDESDDSSEPESPVIEVDLTPSPTSLQLPEVLRHTDGSDVAGLVRPKFLFCANNTMTGFYFFSFKQRVTKLRLFFFFRNFFLQKLSKVMAALQC